MPTATRMACSQPRCPYPAVHRGRCQVHRLSTSQRGYGRTHQGQRAMLARTLPAPCGYGCGTLLHPQGRWVAAHVVDGDPNAGYVAACVTCNERAKVRGDRPVKSPRVGLPPADPRSVSHTYDNPHT